MGDQNQALAISPQDRLKKIMRGDETMSRFAEILGSHDAPAYVSSVLLAVANSPSLQECTPTSIIVSAMRAATLRLSCDPSTRQAHLVPFRDHGTPKATLVIGYKGYQDMAIRTGKYRYMNAFIVREGQTVTEDQIKGIHTLTGAPKFKDGPAIGYMLAFELRDGFSKTVYMTVEEVQEHAKRYSKNYNNANSLWKTEFDKMALKTVVRLGLGRWGYLSPSDQMVLNAIEEDAPDAISSSVDDGANIQEGDFQPAPEEKLTADEQIAILTGQQPERIVKPDGEIVQPDPKPGSYRNPAELKAFLLDLAKKNQPAPANAKRDVAACLDYILLSNDKRHDILKWLSDGKSNSMNTLPAQLLSALFFYLKPAYNELKTVFEPGEPNAAAEISAVWTEYNKANGQGTLI